MTVTVSEQVTRNVVKLSALEQEQLDSNRTKRKVSDEQVNNPKNIASNNFWYK